MSDAVFICDYVRTPIGRYGGALSSIRADDLAALPVLHLLGRCPIPGEDIDGVILGAANQSGEDNRNLARMVVLLSGLPDSVPGLTINRLCASGLDAVATAAMRIKAGFADVMIAGGSESMSRAPFVMPKAETAFARQTEIHDTTIGWRFVNDRIAKQYGIDSMPETAENVAAEFNVTRDDQDRFALSSQSRAAQAMASRRMQDEICAVTIPTRKGASIVIEKDEHPRATTLDKLASLPTPFRENGTVTAGNASGVNDGAAALLLASEAAVSRYSLNPLARFEAFADAGVALRIMGIGPVPATEKLCTRLGVTPGDFDLIELNEAFAAQAIAVSRALKLDPFAEHLNPNGGAIALGHPLGMTGARLVGTAALELSLGNAKRALVSLCVGVGQGVSVALARV